MTEPQTHAPTTTKMRLPRNRIARVAAMNLKMRKCLIINDRILRFMGKLLNACCWELESATLPYVDGERIGQ